MIDSDREIATLAGGCFWCLEAVYNDLKGVESVESGYMGGKTANPSYEDVCSGETGHAEVVQLSFDPKSVSFKEILEVFFVIHDPTTLNRQGNDAGTQYRSAIFYHSAAQKAAAERVIADLGAGKVYDDPIVTEVVPASKFYAAENYHAPDRPQPIRNPRSKDGVRWLGCRGVRGSYAPGAAGCGRRRNAFHGAAGFAAARPAGYPIATVTAFRYGGFLVRGFLADVLSLPTSSFSQLSWLFSS